MLSFSTRKNSTLRRWLSVAIRIKFSSSASTSPSRDLIWKSTTKAEFEEALVVLLPAVADRLGIGDDPLAFFEFVGRVLLVKAVTARLIPDEGRLTHGQRRFLPSLDHRRLAALDLLERLG